MVRGDPRPSERRQSAVRTFLIADIRGFTQFTNELGDEAVARLAAKFAQLTGEAVEAWGGDLIELRGDEALCVFDSPRAALRCAVELQDAYLDETRIEPLLPLTVGIGLDAGEAVPVGAGYRGSALNLAARLCSAAAAGEVIASDGVVHLAGRIHELSYAALDGKPLKGFADPVPAWLVAAERPHDHDAVASASVPDPGLPPELDAIVPLVGRDADLRWFGWHWRRARHGHGAAITVGGPHGMGRTRLAAEVAAIAHGQGAAVRYVGSDGDLDLPSGPALIVIDDIDQMPGARVERLLGSVPTTGDHRLVVIIHGDSVADPLASSLDHLASPDRRRRLEPLDADAVASIARVYLEGADEDPPTHLLLEESAGIPAAAHRVASQWARATAARRLGDSARRTSRERRDLRAAEADMIDDVARLELARERSRLFVDLRETAGSEPGPAVTICPYKGLAAFEAADAKYYFGRERLIAELIARMVGSAFIGLIGASGSGKSSALQAGLLPALAGGVLPGSDEWIQVSMRPGEHPMQQLQAALARSLPGTSDRDPNPRHLLDTALEEMAPAQRTLVVIDQFEELFTAVADEVERTSFIDFITEPRRGLKILIAVRADHYGRCAAYPRLARALAADQVLVGPLAADEIAAIVRHPAEGVGLRVEPELVDALVADVGVEPGGLPLLSTALLELWGARDTGRLTLAAYRATGGVRGAIARMAEANWGRLDDAQQVVARAVFFRLAGESEGGAVVRQRVKRAELDVDDSRGTALVIDHLTAARLLTVSDGYVEVAHEALLREWPRLRDWIQDDAESRQLRLHLTNAARAWEAGGREDGDLYRGARLASVLDWSAEHMVEMNAAERAFVEHSAMAAERDAARQRRANRNLRALLAGTAVLLAVAVGAGAFAAHQAREARGRELYASAISVLEDDPELSIHLALQAEALGVQPPPDAVTALHEAAQDARTILNVTLPAEDVRPINLVVGLSPDGSRMYVSPDTRSVQVYDVDSARLVRTLGSPRPLSAQTFSALSVSPDGSRVAVIDEAALVHVWDVESGREQLIQAAGLEPDVVLFSPDGALLATKTYTEDDRDAVVAVWDLVSGAKLREWTFEWMFSLVFHPDGDRLLGTACPCNADDPVILLDINTGEATVAVDSVAGIEASSPTAAFFNPTATLLATAGQDGKINLWDATSGDHVREFVGHTDPVNHMAFTPQGDRLATTSVDGTTRIWDVATGSQVTMLAGQGGSPGSAAFSADGSRLATGSSNMTVRVWDVAAPTQADVTTHRLGATFEQVKDLARAGKLLVALARACSGYCPGDVLMLDLEDGSVSTFAESQVGAAVGVTPGGEWVFTQAGIGEEHLDPGPIHRRATEQGMGSLDLEGICDALPDWNRCIDPAAQAWAFAVHPDGSQVVATGFSDYGLNRHAQVSWLASWSSSDGALRAVRADGGTYSHVAFSPDGTLIATSRDDRIAILDAVSLDEVATVAMVLPRRLAFSPDGALLAAASATDETAVIDVATWSILHSLRPAFDVDFSHDGTNVLTADADGFVRLWDARRGRELHAVPGVTGFARFVDDDRHFITTDTGDVLVMTLDTDELFDIAEGRLSRSMTEAECEKYLHASCESAPSRSVSGPLDD